MYDSEYLKDPRAFHAKQYRSLKERVEKRRQVIATMDRMRMEMDPETCKEVLEALDDAVACTRCNLGIDLDNMERHRLAAGISEGGR